MNDSGSWEPLVISEDKGGYDQILVVSFMHWSVLITYLHDQISSKERSIDNTNELQ